MKHIQRRRLWDLFQKLAELDHLGSDHDKIDGITKHIGPGNGLPANKPVIDHFHRGHSPANDPLLIE